MPTPSKTLIELENKFWQAIVDDDADTAVEMLSEPSVLVGAHGAMKFDHEGYRKMAANPMKKLTRFELSDVVVPPLLGNRFEQTADILLIERGRNIDKVGWPQIFQQLRQLIEPVFREKETRLFLQRVDCVH